MQRKKASTHKETPILGSKGLTAYPGSVCLGL